MHLSGCAYADSALHLSDDENDSLPASFRCKSSVIGCFIGQKCCRYGSLSPCGLLQRDVS
eukprot:52519-Pleurochrysis_carterae.AAC.1